MSFRAVHLDPLIAFAFFQEFQFGSSLCFIHLLYARTVVPSNAKVYGGSEQGQKDLVEGYRVLRKTI